MAYTMDIGSIVMLTVEGRLFGQQVLTSFPYRLSQGPTAVNGAALLSGLIDAFMGDDNILDEYAACMSNDVAGLRVRGQMIHTNRFAFIEKFPAVDPVQVADDCVGSNVAIAMTKRSEAATPHSRSTLHLFGLPKSFITDGTLNGLGKEKYDLLGSLIPAEIAVGAFGNIFEPVIYNRAVPSASETVQSAAVQLYTRTMHRRTVGLGS